MSSIYDQIQAEINKRRGGTGPVDNQFSQMLEGGRVLPNEQAFMMENPLAPTELLQLMGMRQPAEATPEITQVSLNGNESGVKLEEAGHALVMEGLELGSGAPVHTLPNQAFLRSVFIEGTIIRKVSRQLFFLDLANRQTTKSSEIVWFRDKFAEHNDPLLRDPTPIAEGAELPLTVVSDPVKKRASTGKYGVATIFTDRAMRNTNTAFNEVQRKLDAVAYAFSAKINRIYANVLANKFDSTFNASKPIDDQVLFSSIQDPWDDPAANPIEDIRDAVLQMEETDEYFYPASEIWLPPKSWKDLMTFATSVDHDWNIDPLNKERVRTIDEIAIRKVPPLAGIPDGNAILIARGAGIPPPLDVWDEVDTRFTKSGMVHVQRVFDEKTLNTWFGFHRTFVAVNRNPRSVLVFEGLR
jgi:hypothetical protein